MNDIKLTEFLDGFKSRVRDARFGEIEEDGVQPLNEWETAFTDVFISDLIDVGQLSDCDLAYFDKRVGRSNAKCNGFSISVDGEHLDLITAICPGQPDGKLSSVPPGDVSKALARALQVFVATSKPIHIQMEPASSSFDMAERIHAAHDGISKVRLVAIVYGNVNIDKVTPPALDDCGVDVKVDVWDIERLYRASSAGLTYESVKIDLEQLLGKPLPCLQAEQSESDHRCYLTVFPGELLHGLYHEHGPRLLELNVRSFLQARGKVNRGIRDTLSNEPGHFLPFNNGISTTVESIELCSEEDGSCSIRNMTGFQIVNGGQTVASIHRAKERDNLDLSKVYVQAKITQVDAAYLDELVPSISRFSNTQNKVNETDFSANHPYHVAIQQLSQRVWCTGEQTRWFYERARGQWEVARSREGNTPARLRTFDSKTPKSQKFDKTLVAQAANAWDMYPHIVSLGGQKNFVDFMQRLESRPASWEPDEVYYKHLVAKILIFKQAQRVARLLHLPAYRANAVNYTVSALAHRTNSRVNLDGIWYSQTLSEAVVQTIQTWMPVIWEELTESAGGRNVTEWCKKVDCWSHIQSLRLEFAPGLDDELAEGMPLPTVGKYKDGASMRDLSSEERQRQSLTTKYDAHQWVRIVEWGTTSGKATAFQLNVAGTVIGYAAGGWNKVPSPKQTKHTCGLIKLWQEHNPGLGLVEA